MGRPLNKKNFGTTTTEGEIKVQFYNGSASVDGWIIKQLGTKKFRCSDGTATADCYLVDKLGAALAAGEMSMTVKNDAGDVKQVVKIAAKKVTVDTGESIGWNYSTSVTDGKVEAEESGGSTSPSAVPVAASAVVSGKTYRVTTGGDTVWSGFGSAFLTDGTDSFVVGTEYVISNTISGSDFTTVGAADNVPGTIFVATGTSAGGVGVVYEAVFTATNSGTGTGFAVELDGNSDHGTGR